jgi:hypothetical protein
VRKRLWFRAGALVLIGSLLVGCSTQAAYMRGWDAVTGQSHRWTGGTFNPGKLSADETVVYQKLGTPDVIRFFRALHTRQRVYEWLYDDPEQVIWFVAGTRVDYVAVDTNTSSLTKEKRETVQTKLTTGGVLGTVVGGIAAGFLLLGDSLGLKN